MMFNGIKRKKLDEIVKKVNGSNLLKRYLMLILGCFIVALAFNVFFLQFNIVCFGISGLSIILNQFGVNPSVFILGANIVLLIVSYFTLSKEETMNSIVGSLIFPIFTSLTKTMVGWFPLEGVDMLVIAIFGAVISGFGYGIIFKTGFTTGGTDIVDQILAKYTKISLGKAMIFVDGLVVLSAKLVFSWEIVLYGFIVLYIISMLTDKVILGISQSKAFYIITNKEEEVREYLINYIHSGVTLVPASGGYSNNKGSMLLTVIPTSDYFVVKEGIKAIDKKAFFLVCDAYEVSNGGEKHVV